MSDMIVLTRSHLTAEAQAEAHGELTGGVTGSFPVVSIRGKVFRVKAKGQEQVVKNADGDPAGSIKVVIVKAHERLSKIYYPKAYEEGSDESPTCFSVDGIRPDPAAESPQHTVCETCKHNVWGSKITPNGAKTKSCADSRRLVVVPTGDIHNVAMGGPMLFRVPPSSLGELTDYADKIKAAGGVYYEVSTKISFDQEASHAKPIFHFDCELTDEQFAAVMEMRTSDPCLRILQEAGSPSVPAESEAPGSPVSAVPDPEPVTPPPAVTVVEDDTPAPAQKKTKATKGKAKEEEPATDAGEVDVNDVISSLLG